MITDEEIFSIIKKSTSRNEEFSYVIQLHINKIRNSSSIDECRDSITFIKYIIYDAIEEIKKEGK